MRRRKPLFLVTVPALLVLLMAMTACQPVQPTGAGAFRAEPSSATESGAVASGRLVVHGMDGNLYAMDARGANTVALTSDASATVQYLQPSWSPSADQLAWTRVEQRDGEAEVALVVAGSRGEDQTTYEVPFPPFYISWNPDSARLAYLSAWSSAGRPSMALRLLDPSVAGEPLSTLAEGQPFYLSWSPDGERLLTHVQNERVDIQALDGSRQFLQRSEAAFPAPQWFPSGETLLYAVTDGAGQRLIVAGLDGMEQAEVTDFDGTISFTLSPDEGKIAYVITSVASGTAAFGPLFVVDLASGATRQLSELPVLAFFWSPDSEKLAFLALDDSSSDFLFRWRVWDGGKMADYAAVLPTRTFLERYLAFFDQYAQSMTLWSPDSRAFAYAGTGQIDASPDAESPTRRTGVWVQALDADAPRYIGPGVYTAWSPR